MSHANAERRYRETQSVLNATRTEMGALFTETLSVGLNLVRTQDALRAVLMQIAAWETSNEEYFDLDYDCTDCTVRPPNPAKPLCARHRAERLLKEVAS